MARPKDALKRLGASPPVKLEAEAEQLMPQITELEKEEKRMREQMLEP
jgi:hypothetical protein